MMDEIFEMVMKEARSRPGGGLKVNAYYVINDLYKMVFHTIEYCLEKALKSHSEEDKIP